MKIAMPKEGELLNQHFGRSKSFVIITLQNKNIIDVKEISTESFQHNHGGLSTLLENEGVSLVITGGMGPGAFNALMEKRINIIRGASGRIEDILKQYIKGTLSDKEVECNHHVVHNDERIINEK